MGQQHLKLIVGETGQPLLGSTGNACRPMTNACDEGDAMARGVPVCRDAPPLSEPSQSKLGIAGLCALALTVWAASPLDAGAQQRSTEVGAGATTLDEARRVALVVGNEAYSPAEPLSNPVNDATAVADALEELGFDVMRLLDAPQDEMDLQIIRFGRQIRSGDVALFYYAGHGLQVEGENYLVPVDADIENEAQVKERAIAAGFVLDAMANANAGLRIMILDACRNNPYMSRGWRGGGGGTRGLSAITADGPTLIAYATAPNDVAADGDGDHSPYTEELVRHIRQPLPVGTMFERVQNAVYERTDRRQAPFISSGPMLGFSLVDGVDMAAVSASNELSLRDSTRAANVIVDGASTTASETDTMVATAEPPSYTQREALSALYEATHGSAWSVSEGLWLTNGPLDEWFGVTTDAEGYVTRIDLNNRGLAGPIPIALGDLRRLEYLDLSGNQLSGRIPPEIERMERLTHLILMGNKLEGPIPPQLSSLTQLTYLDLDGNELTGRIPDLSNLSNLTEIWLAQNRITGPIPAWLGTMERLVKIGLDNNRLDGEIPGTLGRLHSLQRLYASDNDLAGSIPTEFGGLESLERLGLKGNRLVGPIPPQIGSLTGLKRLELSDNRLDGVIPPQLGMLDSLEFLNLSQNDLEGDIPVQLSGLERLTVLDLSENGLTGSIAPQFGELAALTVLNLQSNNLVGAIPPTLGQLAKASVLNLKDNRLSGRIPPELGRLGQLTQLLLRDNQLTGPLPTELANLQRILVLQIGDSEGLCVPRELESWYERFGYNDVRAPSCDK